MVVKICSCGRVATFTGYCNKCELILREQLDKELKEEGIYVQAEHREFMEILAEEETNPSPIERFPEGSEPV